MVKVGPSILCYSVRDRFTEAMKTKSMEKTGIMVHQSILFEKVCTFWFGIQLFGGPKAGALNQSKLKTDA